MLPLLLAGAWLMPREARVGLATACLLVLLYLGYAYPPGWVGYYLDAVPVLAFATAYGVARVARALWLQGPLRKDRPVLYAATAVCVILGCIWLVHAVAAVPAARRRNIAVLSPYAAFAKTLSRIPSARSIVFVRYPSYHSWRRSLIANEPDLDRARVWIVHDRGPDNARLLAFAPDRDAYLYDEQRGVLEPLGAK